MADKQRYECEKCGSTAETSDTGERQPECCGKPMAKAESLPVCELSTTAEHARGDDLGEPCDDGRSGTG